MENAPRDGQYVVVSTGGAYLTFAYFHDGAWIAPQMIGKPALGSSVVEPVGWINLPTPVRH